MTSAVDHEQPENGQSRPLPWPELADGLQDVVVEERHGDDADDAQQSRQGTTRVVSEKK